MFDIIIHLLASPFIALLLALFIGGVAVVAYADRRRSR